MWALGFLLIVLVYFFVVAVISARLQTDAKRHFLLAAIAIPITYPFWYGVSPSYYEFQQLCDRDDRYVVAKIEEVDYVYSDSGCYLGYAIIKDRPFKGYECERSRETSEGSKRYEKKLFRYSRSENWNTSVCQAECLNRGYYASWEKTCQSQCFNETEISRPSFKFRSTYEATEIIKGKLVKTRLSKTNENNEDLVVLNDYTYYMYGNGWAKILGLSSGSAPSLTCQKKYKIQNYDFLKPISRN